MSIVDVALFESLSPRSNKKILCKCDRCGAEKMVVKSNLYRAYAGEKYVFYKMGEEPEGFVPSYDYCNSCDKTVNPGHLGRRHSKESIEKIRVARARQNAEGKSPRPSEDGKRRIAESKIGSKNPQWKSDREMIVRKVRLRKTCSNLIWNTLLRTSQKKTGKFEKLTGYSREHLIEWIESQFTPEMSWDNIAIDHIIPVSAFVKHGITDLRIINHPKNLRPMLRLDNIAKGDRYNEQDFWDYLDSMNYVSPVAEKNNRSS